MGVWHWWQVPACFMPWTPYDDDAAERRFTGRTGARWLLGNLWKTWAKLSVA